MALIYISVILVMLNIFSCVFLCVYWPFAHLQWKKSLFISSAHFFREGNGTPLQYSCLENPMDGGAWQASEVHGVAKSQTRLSDFTFTFHFSLSRIGERNGNPLQCSCLENPRGGEAGGLSVESHRVGHN